MNENRRVLVHQMARELMPVVYADALKTGDETGLFKHDDWQTGISLEAYRIAEVFEHVSLAWELQHK